ncbi:MAG TPA: DUF6580 family putative transport protein [Xanthobacteraceae bacterium]|jgi:hypothetical protein
MIGSHQIRRHGSSELLDLGMAATLIGLDMATRLLPHPPNFTAIAASGLFAGAVLRSRILALAVPLAAMALSDGVLGFYDWPTMAAVYFGLAVPAWLGLFVRRFHLALLLPAAAVCSLFFFIETNFAVWLFSGIYPRHIDGLIACYVAALPFFHNTLNGDVFWTATMLLSYWIARICLAKGASMTAPVPASR